MISPLQKYFNYRGKHIANSTKLFVLQKQIDITTDPTNPQKKKSVSLI